MDEILIRHFAQADQPAVLRIAADTAFFGEPVEAFLDDRTLFGDFFVGFYTAHKASYCWVADNGENVIGYLLGSDQNVIQSEYWRQYFVSRVIKGALSRKYRIGRRTISYGFGTMIGYIKGEEPPVDLTTYPAHLHINISQGYRSGGIGRRLIGAYLDQLREMSVQGVYLHTTSQNKAACHIYEKLGFQVLSSRHNSYWSKWFGYPVDNISYGIKLI
jgi:ribosomal protein S18 acetylase RimI-like enzyme